MARRHPGRSCPSVILRSQLIWHRDIAVERQPEAGAVEIAGVGLGMPLRDVAATHKTHHRRGSRHRSRFDTGPATIRRFQHPDYQRRT